MELADPASSALQAAAALHGSVVDLELGDAEMAVSEEQSQDFAQT